MSSERLNHLAVALDTSDWQEFDAWCGRLGPRAGVLKVGLEAFVRWGPEAVKRAHRTGARVFLDLKLHDIPNTVAGAARVAADLGASYLTVHASGGRRMIEAATEAAYGGLGVLAVTLLTHLDEVDLADLALSREADDHVAQLAEMAVEGGCAGVVCSPLEVKGLRAALAADVEIVTPGIRLADAPAGDDQRRVATPEQALADGADLLVIGRPLTSTDDPEAVLVRLATAAATK